MRLTELGVAAKLATVPDTQSTEIGGFRVVVFRHFVMSAIGDAWTYARMKAQTTPSMWPALAFHNSSGQWRFLVPVWLSLPEASEPTLLKAHMIWLDQMTCYFNEQGQRS